MARHVGVVFQNADHQIVSDTVWNEALFTPRNLHCLDPSIERRATRWLAAAGLADRLAIQLAYAIGVAEPVSVMVDSFGTARIDEMTISELIREHFQLTITARPPLAISVGRTRVSPGS